MHDRYKYHSHCVFNLGYHIIFCPKYRRKLLQWGIDERLNITKEPSLCYIESMSTLQLLLRLAVDAVLVLGRLAYAVLDGELVDDTRRYVTMGSGHFVTFPAADVTKCPDPIVTGSSRP